MSTQIILFQNRSKNKSPSSRNLELGTSFHADGHPGLFSPHVEFERGNLVLGRCHGPWLFPGHRAGKSNPREDGFSDLSEANWSWGSAMGRGSSTELQLGGFPTGGPSGRLTLGARRRHCLKNLGDHPTENLPVEVPSRCHGPWHFPGTNLARSNPKNHRSQCGFEKAAW